MTPTSKRRPRNKGAVWLVMLIVLAAVGAGSLAVAASTLSTITRSDETAAVFNDAGELPPALIDSVLWAEDPADLPRPMEPLTRADIASSWLRAWEQLRIVAETGDTSGVEVYFSNSAADGVLATVPDENDTAQLNRSLRQESHLLRIAFYSDDGQVVGLSSDETVVRRSWQFEDEVMEATSVESFEAVLVLEDGNWRIHHLVRRSVETGPWTPQAEAAAGQT